MACDGRTAKRHPTGYDYNCNFEDKGNGINVLKQDHGTKQTEEQIGIRTGT
jgi:hypothetical protein